MNFRPALLSAALVLSIVSGAEAAGIGAYFEYANVFDGQFSTDYLGDLDYEEDHFGGGLSFDTNVAMDRLFNYRLDLGYQHVEQKYDHAGSFDADGLSIDNAFGFGVFRSPNIRIWVGPAVRLSFDFFDHSGGYDFGIGLGPEAGINFHTSSRASIGMTAGYQVLYTLFVPDDDSFDDEDGYEQAVVLKLVVLFRTAGDSFGE